tara:strand:+ start:361 stop:633 length:273 start_codon:yes stop_codon:yes gene_type:complete
MPQNETFYGYSNHSTMNVALAIQNDAELYATAKGIIQAGVFGGAAPFAVFRETLREQGTTMTSCGGFSYSDPRLDMGELDEVIRDIGMKD